jgi:DNA-binding transcriptional ArsR family regulator
MRTDSPTAAFEALADPVRCAVVERLGERPHSAGELAELVGVSPSSMSRHLRMLLRAELISDERGRDDARVRMFRLCPEGLAATTAWMDQVQAHWRANLASFQAHVEG